MTVFLADIDGVPVARNEIAGLTWFDPGERFKGTVAPAVAKHVVPRLQDHGLLESGTVRRSRLAPPHRPQDSAG